MVLRTEFLTAEAFASFGDVILAPSEPGRSAPSTAVGPVAEGLAAMLTTSHALPSAEPITVSEMEVHPRSSQSFIPLDVGRWLAIVAPGLTSEAEPSVGGPDMSKVRVFVVGPGVGVTYRAGVWHHGLTVLDRPGRFAVMMWREPSDAAESHQSDTIFCAVDPVAVRP
ncbi:MAG: ureidoglycolate lyase [Acidimicrobiales bacterium]|jgi:ureidoglycolate lyase